LFFKESNKCLAITTVYANRHTTLIGTFLIMQKQILCFCTESSMQSATSSVCGSNYSGPAVAQTHSTLFPLKTSLRHKTLHEVGITD